MTLKSKPQPIRLCKQANSTARPVSPQSPLDREGNQHATAEKDGEKEGGREKRRGEKAGKTKDQKRRRNEEESKQLFDMSPTVRCP